jgi:transitional endoplasmic reticulum ATPase
VTVVDFDEIEAATADGRVDLLDRSVFGTPPWRMRLWVARGVREHQAVYLLGASLRRDSDPTAGPGVLGRDPLGQLLERRMSAGDAWASRVVDGVGTAMSQLSRWLAHDRPELPRAAHRDDAIERVDAASGLRVTVTGLPGADADREPPDRIDVAATVPAGKLTAEHLAALLGMLLEAADAAGETGGGEYVLGRHRSTAEAVTLDQVGGLDGVVAQFREVAVSFRHPQVMARWGARRPQGILMYGPPGTGKTMLARALAAEIGAELREIRTPEILDKWLGASERNIKRIFRGARRYREPTILLFDEFDSIISYTGSGIDAASQAVNAVAGIFKQEMNDLIEDNPNVIVVATTNFPERVDESLIRSGRFDIRLEIPRPDAPGRAQILGKMIRELIARHEVAGFQMFAGDVDADALAAETAGMTGADLKEALRRAQLAKAMQEARTGVTPGPISHDDLHRSLAELRRSGSADIVHHGQSQT